MAQMPSREEIITAAEQLAAGTKEPDEVADWAIKLDADSNGLASEALEKTDPKLSTLLHDLALAGTIDENGQLLYGKEEFTQWLKEFKES